MNKRNRLFKFFSVIIPALLILVTVFSIPMSVKAKDLETGETVEYKVVGSSQADSLNFMISDESPVGRALKESKKGETVKVDTPAGVLKFKIIDIWKD